MQLNKTKEDSASLRRATAVLRSRRFCALFVVALCLVMVAGCASTGNRPRILQRLQDRKINENVDDGKKNDSSSSSKDVESGEKSSTVDSGSGERSQYVDNAAARDTSNADAGQAVNLPYRSYAPSLDQEIANTQPTLDEPGIADPTPLTTQGTDQVDKVIEVSQSVSEQQTTSQPEIAADPQTTEPAPAQEQTASESSTPEPPTVADPVPETSPSPEPESSVPTPPTTFEPASASVEQPVASEPEPESSVSSSESQTSELAEPTESETSAPVGLQGDSSVGEIAKETASRTENEETPETSGSEPESASASAEEGNPNDSTDDSNWEPKYSSNKTGRNVQLKNAVYSRVRSGNARPSGSVRMKPSAQQVEVPNTASIVVERIAPFVPVALSGVSATEECVDASKYRGRRAR